MTAFAAVSAHFRRDIDFDLARIGGIVADARGRHVDVLVLPHGVFGGYHDILDEPHHAGDRSTYPRNSGLPPSVDLDGPEVAELVALTHGVTVVCGVTERVGDHRANTALCMVDGELVGHHRKVHLPVGERCDYVAGDRFDVVDTPHARLGMLVDYDKTFPESARALAQAGAEVLAIPSAWPASRTNRADTLTRDRQRRMYDLYDRTRAAENQVIVISANQIGRHGSLRFFGQSKIVTPDGDVSAVVGSRSGMAICELDVTGSIAAARQRFFHLDERRPDTYRSRC